MIFLEDKFLSEIDPKQGVVLKSIFCLQNDRFKKCPEHLQKTRLVFIFVVFDVVGLE